MSQSQGEHTRPRCGVRHLAELGFRRQAGALLAQFTRSFLTRHVRAKIVRLSAKGACSQEPRAIAQVRCKQCEQRRRRASFQIDYRSRIHNTGIDVTTLETHRTRRTAPSVARFSRRPHFLGR
jgi:hypothetical protein